MSVWKKEESILSREQEEQIDSFFSNLENSKTLEYREGQHTMALDIADTIKDRSILLIESGVGSGKSWAYLVPLLYASSGSDKFKGFIISTSSKALQDQLKKEIENLSEMLDLPKIDVTIAKGRTNYLCKRRFEYFAERHDRQQEKIKSIKERLDQGKVERADYSDLSQNDWKKMNVDKVNCGKCIYNTECTYRVKRKRWPESKAVICNHNLLVEALKRDSESPLLNEPSILIVDEAHALEEKIRDSYKKVLNKRKLETLILELYSHLNKNADDIPVIDTLNSLFRRISTNAKREYLSHSTENIDFFDSENSSFKCTKSVTNLTETLIKQLSDLEEEAVFNSHYNRDNDFLEQINTLQENKRAFQDLILSNENQKNVYWAAFLPDTLEHIEIQYVPRNIPELAKRLLNNPNYGKVFTSATLTTKGDYEYFIKGLGIDPKEPGRILSGKPLPSPFNYDENALLYCPLDLVSPKDSNHELYLESITTKISELIDITEGRTLVLFTAKKDMQEVYKRIREEDKPYNIYIQEDGKDTETLKTKFKEDTTSCLFATGSFFEGIDIKGESLESVIIPKLPFHVVDPVMDAKAKYYADGSNTVYLQDMLIKLKQGTGRLIRSEKDKGIVSILDPRVKDYKEAILGTLPFTNVTCDINDVIAFADKNLSKNKEQKDAKEYIKK